MKLLFVIIAHTSLDILFSITNNCSSGCFSSLISSSEKLAINALIHRVIMILYALDAVTLIASGSLTYTCILFMLTS